MDTTNRTQATVTFRDLTTGAEYAVHVYLDTIAAMMAEDRRRGHETIILGVNY